MTAVYSETLIELARTNPNIYVLEADLMLATGTISFKQEFPDRFLDVGVAEANMVGLAAGLSTLGKIPFCSSFTPFVTRRAYDQITISVAYAKRNVKLVGSDPGITAGSNGGTHMCFQDLAIMRVMPGMIVLSPADAYELRATIRWMAQYEGPVYLQLLRAAQPQLFDQNYQFQLGLAVGLSEGDDVTLVSTGYMTQFAYRASLSLRDKGIGVDLLHFPTIKPFDAKTLVESAKKTGRVVVVENQNTLGGLGGAVCETLGEHYPVPVKRLGVPDHFGEVGTADYLFDKHGFGVEHIIQAVETTAALPV